MEWMSSRFVSVGATRWRRRPGWAHKLGGLVPASGMENTVKTFRKRQTQSLVYKWSQSSNICSIKSWSIYTSRTTAGYTGSSCWGSLLADSSSSKVGCGAAHLKPQNSWGRAGRSVWVWGQPGLHRDILPPPQKKVTKKSSVCWGVCYGFTYFLALWNFGTRNVCKRDIKQQDLAMLWLPVQTNRKSGVRASVLWHENRERSRLCGGIAGVCPLQTTLNVCIVCTSSSQKRHMSHVVVSMN